MESASTSASIVNVTAAVTATLSPEVIEEWKLYQSTNMFCYQVVFPILFIVGVTGNLLNLVVLLSREMRSSINTMLAAMAFADMVFLITMFPKGIITAFTGREAKLMFKVHFEDRLGGLSNSFSAASAWFVVAVSLERLMAICMPLRARFFWGKWKLRMFISSVFLCAFLLNLNTQINPQNSQEISPHIYHKISHYFQVALVVIIPIMILFVTNTLLVIMLRKQQNILGRTKIQTVKSPVHNKRSKISIANGQTSAATGVRASELKVALTVALVCAGFTISHLPSGVATGYTEMSDITSPANANVWPTYYRYLIYSNMLVIFGKVMNFFLFCTSSASFRRKLITMLSIYKRRYADHLPSFVHSQTGFTHTSKVHRNSSTTLIVHHTNNNNNKSNKSKHSVVNINVQIEVKDVETPKVYQKMSMPNKKPAKQRQGPCERRRQSQQLGKLLDVQDVGIELENVESSSESLDSRKYARSEPGGAPPKYQEIASVSEENIE